MTKAKTNTKDKTNTKAKPKTNVKRKSKKAGNSEYAGEISQDDKGKYWLQGGLSPIGRVIYPSVFKSKLTFDGRAKQNKGKDTEDTDREFTCTLLYKKNDPRLKSMEIKIAELAKVGLGKKKWDTPIKDGTAKWRKDKKEGKDSEAYKDMKYMVLKRPGNLEAPVVLDENGEEMLAQSEFYPGCYAMAKLSFKPYTTFGGGITCYWSAIKKVADGEKLGFDMVGAAKNDFAKESSSVDVDESGAVTY